MVIVAVIMVMSGAVIIVTLAVRAMRALMPGAYATDELPTVMYFGDAALRGGNRMSVLIWVK